MHSFRLPFAAFLLSTTFALSFAQPALFAGGGLHSTRLESAPEQSDNGYRGVAGLQLAGDHLGVVLQGGFAGFAARGRLAPNASRARSETRLVEAHVLPKFYLRRGDISAYFIAGGGPQWTLRETWTETNGEAGARSSGTQLDGGLQFGFGVEATVSERLKVGLQPSYHAVYWNGRREFEYASFVAYLML